MRVLLSKMVEGLVRVTADGFGAMSAHGRTSRPPHGAIPH